MWTRIGLIAAPAPLAAANFRLELVYLPSPYKEEKVNFTVSIGGQ